jgi:putative transposase
MRLPGYDYSQTAIYHITTCTHDRECLFGEVLEGTLVLNEAGAAVQRVWVGLPLRFPQVKLDAFVVMPNHVHGIIILQASASTTATEQDAASSAPTLGRVMRAFKSISAIRVNGVLSRSECPVWQRNYYEHVVRGETDLHRIRQYIVDNPADWRDDEYNPCNVVAKPWR